MTGSGLAADVVEMLLHEVAINMYRQTMGCMSTRLGSKFYSTWCDPVPSAHWEVSSTILDGVELAVENEMTVGVDGR